MPYFLRSTTRESRVRKPSCFSGRAQIGLVIGQRLGQAVTHRAGLTRETAAGDRDREVVLARALGDAERLLDDHAQHRTREIDRHVAAVDRDLARAGLDPDARDGVLALAGGVGATLLVELLHIFRRLLRGGDGRLVEVGEGGECGLGHDQALREFLEFSAATSSDVGALRRVRMLGALVDAQIAELDAAERAARQHALDGLFEHALGKAPLEDRLGRPLLDAAGIAGVAIIDLLLALAAGQHHLVGVDDDDVVAVVHVRGEGRLMLAAQAQGDDRGEAPDDEPLGVDQHPFLFNVGGLRRIGFTKHGNFVPWRLGAFRSHGPCERQEFLQLPPRLAAVPLR